MIYTCTLNPSIDYRVELDEFEVGGLNRAKENAYYPGGKGINVSRVLKNLGTDNMALGFLGGFTGQFILDFLNREKIESDFIFHEAPTRVNVKVKTRDSETEINGKGAFISKDNQEMLLEKIRSLTKEDYLVISGSLPQGISFDFYEKMVSIAKEKGVSWIIDISGPNVKKLLHYKPFLIKPNHHELAQILEKEIATVDDVVAGAKELVQLGAQNVIVSMGGKGAIFVNDKLTLKAEAPKGTVKSTVGAGDSMVAGFLSSYIKNKDPKASFAFSVATGSATAFSDDLCRLPEANQLLPYIKIQTWKEEK